MLQGRYITRRAGGEAAAKLQAATTKIYEACSFQDITGQRITKVVTTLKTIESKVAHIVNTFGATAAGTRVLSAHVATDADLLNGPQLPAHTARLPLRCASAPAAKAATSSWRTCSHSIFPQQGNPACWWLERHTSQWE